MKHKGFTLLELLVTISIIGILIAVGATNFRVANQKARDGRRQADLEQIRAALELYRSDENGYPISDIINDQEIIGSTGNIYMETVPTDPKSDFTYYYTSDGVTYTLCASLEVTTTGVCEPAGASCGTDVSCNYQLQNPK